MGNSSLLTGLGRAPCAPCVPASHLRSLLPRLSVKQHFGRPQRTIIHKQTVVRAEREAFTVSPAHISDPTQRDLTKKGAFQWSKLAQEAFEKLKKIMCSCPVLVPDFSMPFVVACDASREGDITVVSEPGSSRTKDTMDRLIQMQERLIDNVHSLAFIVQGGSTFKEEPRVSRSNMAATRFKEYQTLPSKIRDALTFSEFINLEEDRVGIGTWSKPRTLHKGNGRNTPTLEERSPILREKQGETTKLVEVGAKTPNSPYMNENSSVSKVKKEEELLQQQDIEREPPLDTSNPFAKDDLLVTHGFKETIEHEPREKEHQISDQQHFEASIDDGLTNTNIFASGVKEGVADKKL